MVSTCLICLKPVSSKNSIKCNLCKSVVHFKCNFLNSIEGAIILKENNFWHCHTCSKNLFPFNDLNDNKFNLVNHNNIKFSSNDNKLNLHLPQNLTSLFNHFNDVSSEINKDPENSVNCKYYDTNEMQDFNNLIDKTSFSLFHLNISSLPKHFDDLQQLLLSIKIDFDILAITESRISSRNDTTHNLEISNYSREYCTTESSAGGTVLYIKNIHSFIPRPDLQIYKSTHLESNFVEIINPKKPNIIVGCIYRHPCMDLNEFNDSFLNTLLDKISKENKSIFLLGDFNIDLLRYDHHNATNEFLDSLSSNMFLPCIFLPTRISEYSKTLIDNIFTNKFANITASGYILASISDHLPQFSIFSEITSNSPTPKSNVFERDWSNFDHENFFLKFFDLNLFTLLKPEDLDIEYSFNKFLEVINNLLDEFAPLKKISKYKLKFKNKPWITNDIKNLINIKNVYFSKYIKTKNNVIKNYFHTKYKTYRNLLSTLMKRSKDNYFRNYFSKNINDIKKTWKGIKSIISSSKSNFDGPQSIYCNNRYITDPVNVANTFNTFFCSVGQDVQSSIKFSLRSFDYYLSDPNTNSFFLTPTDPIEVSEVLNSLSDDKAQGPNGIPTKILKLLKKEMSTILSTLYNMSFLTGVFPSVLKIAKVIPIHKKLSKLDCSNYRPISILSNLDKILERLIYNRLYKFLENNNCIYPFQFGFRKNYSTSLALRSLTENIQQQVDKGKIGCGIFIDFQKAFDTVDHNILLSKLNHYGIRGLANNWFKSYLKDRKQFVSVNGFQSNSLTIKCGVPQGSILGPLLFLIYINDIYSSIKFCKIHHFADDTNLLNFSNSIKQLNKETNRDLKNLMHWLNANKIVLNISKTELVLFKPLRKKLDSDLKLVLNGKKLYPSSSVKYLGIRIDSNLNWKDHSNLIAIKLNKANSILSKLRYYVNSQTLKSIYYSLFESYFNYAMIVWAQNINSSNRLFLLQKKAIRIINFAPHLSHTNPLFSSSKIIKFYDKISIENTFFISKYLFGFLPSIFNDWFELCSSSHNYILRSCDLGILKVPNFRTKSHGRFSFRINSIYTWNILQRQIKHPLFFKMTPNKVKSYLKDFFLNHYH